MKLGKRDSAILFKSNGDIDLAIPKSKTVPRGALTAMALYYLLEHDHELRARIKQQIDRMMEKLKENRK